MDFKMRKDVGDSDVSSDGSKGQIQDVKPRTMFGNKKLLLIVAVLVVAVIIAAFGIFTYFNNRDQGTKLYQINEGKAASSLIDSFEKEADVLEKSTQADYVKNSTAAAASARSDLGEDKL